MVQASRNIPEPYQSTLIYLLRFLLLVTDHEVSNKMTQTNVAIIFGPSLFKSPLTKTGSLEGVDSSTALAENFLHVKWTQFLLSDFYDIFEPNSNKVHDHVNYKEFRYNDLSNIQKQKKEKKGDISIARKDRIIDRTLSLVVNGSKQVRCQSIKVML